MNLDKIISSFPKDVQESPSMKGLVTLIQTLSEQLQKTQELLIKSEARIKVLEDDIATFFRTLRIQTFC